VPQRGQEDRLRLCGTEWLSSVALNGKIVYPNSPPIVVTRPMGSEVQLKFYLHSTRIVELARFHLTGWHASRAVSLEMDTLMKRELPSRLVYWSMSLTGASTRAESVQICRSASNALQPIGTHGQSRNSQHPPGSPEK
jgi:hypothetical protein